jgi:hypothetical protein
MLQIGFDEHMIAGVFLFRSLLWLGIVPTRAVTQERTKLEPSGGSLHFAWNENGKSSGKDDTLEEMYKCVRKRK